MRTSTALSLAIILGVGSLAAQSLPPASLFDRLVLLVARQHRRGSLRSQGIGRGAVAGDSVAFLFHYTSTDSFHTTFVYAGATDAWQWHMDNDSASVRRPFARVTLTRR
jgi:hypothetical protein